MSMHYVVTRDYHCAYPDAFVAAAGEVLRVARRDGEWPGWIWCDNGRGRSGWVPQRWVRLDGNGTCTLLRDYDATELTASAGDELDVELTESGWAWARAAGGRQGWVPLDHLEPAGDATRGTVP